MALKVKSGGVRRWQNKDGSLTPEGRIHYGLYNESDKNRYDEKFRKMKRDKNGKIKYKEDASVISRDKANYMHYKKQLVQEENEAYYDKLYDKFSKKWDKQYDDKSIEKRINSQFGGDVDHLIYDGYGDTPKEAIKYWDWLHGDGPEQDEWDDYNYNYTSRVMPQYEEELKKSADWIFGSDEMYKEVKKSRETAKFAGWTIGVLAMFGSMVVANAMLNKENRR